MATSFHIAQPNFKPYVLFFSKGQDRNTVLQDTVLKNWRQYCEDGWLSINRKDDFCTENRVKRFLDSCAMFLLISNGFGDIETDQKRSTRERSEIPMSLFPDTSTAPSAGERRKPRKKQRTTFQKIEQIKKEHPGARLEWVRVDADGRFT